MQTNRLISLFVAVSTLLCCLRLAAAHPPPFFWMADVTRTPRVGVEVIAGKSNLLGNDATLVGISGVGEIAVSDAVMLNVRVPVGYGSYTPIGGADESDLALGNISVGATWATRPLRNGARTMFAAGLRAYLPTASDSGGSGLVASEHAAFTVPDPGRYLPDTATLRVHGDLRHEARGALFFQAEVALDHHFVSDADDITAILIGVGAGWAFSPYFALLAELTTSSDIVEDTDAPNFAHSLDVGIRYHGPSVLLGARVYYPLDQVFRDADMLGVALDMSWRL